VDWLARIGKGNSANYQKHKNRSVITMFYYAGGFKMPEWVKLLLKEIREQPAVYIGKKSLDRLAAFLAGYSYCMYQQQNISTTILPGFQEYISEYFKIKSAHNWSSIIVSNSRNDEEAFDMFYDFLEQFYRES